MFKDKESSMIKAHLKIVKEMHEEIAVLQKRVEELESEKGPPASGSQGTSSGL